MRIILQRFPPILSCAHIELDMAELIKVKRNEEKKRSKQKGRKSWASSSTASSVPPTAAQRKDFFPFPQIPVLGSAFSSSTPPWAAEALVQRATGDGAFNAASIAGRIPPATVSVLNAAHRVVRVDFAQLNLGQDHPGQSVENLIHAFAIKRACFRHDGNAHGASPPARLRR